jgi:hypothetical protein
MYTTYSVEIRELQHQMKLFQNKSYGKRKY